MQNVDIFVTFWKFMDAFGIPEKVEVTILLFAKAKELANTSQGLVKLPSQVKGRLILEEILGTWPSLQPLSSCLMLALNESYIGLEEIVNLKNTDEIAVIPPLSGGTTRDSFKGKRVVRLEYEAYVPMAEKELAKICQDMRKKWDVVKIAIIHRIGLVPISEASVVIAISSVHRKDSLEAVQYCIDTLKATVPIWKKEVYDDGHSAWKENSECCNKT